MKTFFAKQLPNARIGEFDDGFSIYRGVLVQWDQDHDERVLQVLDEMPAAVLEKLLVVHESKGGIWFIWDGPTPKGYEEGGPGVTVSDHIKNETEDTDEFGDWWPVNESLSL